MSKKITIRELKLIIESVLSEEISREGIQISITRDEPDERRPVSDKQPTYSVDYVYSEGDSMLQFSGSLKPYHTGRDTEYEFEPSWFQDEESEKYWEENWEEIEYLILKKFYSVEMLNENEMSDSETHSMDYDMHTINGKYASKKTIIDKIYEILKKHNIEKRYFDENWLGIQRLTNVLRQYGVDYDLQNAKYVGHMSRYTSSSLPTAKIYNYTLSVKDSKGKQHLLPLKVTCAFVGKTGTSEDDVYELTYVIEA